MIKNETRNEIEREGNRLVEEIMCWRANEGLAVEDAITETAQTYTDLGLVFEYLLAAGYIDEQNAVNLIHHGITARLREEYGEFF